MTHLMQILTSAEPLSSSEREDLEAWLGGLKRECETFGATPEDNLRMGQISVRLGQKIEIKPQIKVTFTDKMVLVMDGGTLEKAAAIAGHPRSWFKRVKEWEPAHDIIANVHKRFGQVERR